MASPVLPNATPRHRRRIARVGFVFLLAVLALVAGVGAALWHSLRPPPEQQIVLYFEENVHDLVPGSRVRANGITIGKVVRVGLCVPRESGGRYHVRVHAAISPTRLRRLGFRVDSSGHIMLARATAAGLRGKLILLSPLAGEYGIELGMHPGTPLKLVSRTAKNADSGATDGGGSESGGNNRENLEVAVLPGILSGEKRDTYTDRLAEFSQKDFAALEREWNAVLDHWVTTTNPGTVSHFLSNLSRSLDRAGGLLDAGKIRDRLATLNANLDDFRKTLDRVNAALLVNAEHVPDGGGTQNTPAIESAIANAGRNLETLTQNLAATRASLNETTRTLAEFNSALASGDTFAAPLESLRKTAASIYRSATSRNAGR